MSTTRSLNTYWDDNNMYLWLNCAYTQFRVDNSVFIDIFDFLSKINANNTWYKTFVFIVDSIGKTNKLQLSHSVTNNLAVSKTYKYMWDNYYSKFGLRNWYRKSRKLLTVSEMGEMKKMRETSSNKFVEEKISKRHFNSLIIMNSYVNCNLLTKLENLDPNNHKTRSYLDIIIKQEMAYNTGNDIVHSIYNMLDNRNVTKYNNSLPAINYYIKNNKMVKDVYNTMNSS